MFAYSKPVVAAAALAALLVACNAAYTSASPAPPTLNINNADFTAALRKGNASQAAAVLAPAVKQSG